MKINKKAFSLVELIVATVIVTIGIFGISSLLANTQTNINNIWETSKKENIYYNALECFKSNIPNSISVGDKYSIDFGNNLKGYNVTKNGNSKTTIDNIEYLIIAKILEKNSNFIKIKISINGGSNVNKDKIFVINLLN